MFTVDLLKDGIYMYGHYILMHTLQWTLTRRVI